MQMGTYETWGISLTDRAASNKNLGGIAHWLTNEILNHFSEPRVQHYRQHFKSILETENPKRKAHRIHKYWTKHTKRICN